MEKEVIEEMDKKQLPLHVGNNTFLMNMCRIIPKGLGGIFPLAGALIAGKFFQKKLIYHPSIEGLRFLNQNLTGCRSPSEHGWKFADINVKGKDKKVTHGWFINSKDQTDEKLPTLIFFHGNAGNIGHRLPLIEFFQGWIKANFLMMEYRGFGQSKGEPDQTKMEQDCVELMNHLKSEAFQNSQPTFDINQIFIHGSSLGGAFGIFMASKMPIAGLILQNTFTSMTEIASSICSIVGKFEYHVVTEQYPNIERIKQVKCPILFISSQKDELIPPWMMSQLYEAATEVAFKEMFKVEKGTHNDVIDFDDKGYGEAFQKFMKRVKEEQN